MPLDRVFAVSGTKSYVKQAVDQKAKPTRYQAIISTRWQSGLVLETCVKVVKNNVNNIAIVTYHKD